MKRNKTKPDKHTGLGKILGAHILKRELQGILQSTIPVLWGPFWVLFKQSAVARSGTKEFSTQLAAQKKTSLLSVRNRFRVIIG